MRLHWSTHTSTLLHTATLFFHKEVWGNGGLQYITRELHVVCKATTVLIWRANVIYASEIAKVHCGLFFCCFLSQTSFNILKVVVPVDLGFPEKLLGEGGNRMCSGAMYRRPCEAQSRWQSYCAKNNVFSWKLGHLSKCSLSCLSFLICKYFHENRRESSFASVHW